MTGFDVHIILCNILMHSQFCTHQNKSSSALLSQFKIIIETETNTKPKADYSNVDNLL